MGTFSGLYAWFTRAEHAGVELVVLTALPLVLLASSIQSLEGPLRLGRGEGDTSAGLIAVFFLAGANDHGLNFSAGANSWER